MKPQLLVFPLITLASIAQAFAAGNEETLEAYWPMHTPQRSWSLINTSDKDLSAPKLQMSVANKDVGENQVELWFSDKPGQSIGSSDVELYEYCSNPGGEPWLFLNTYINAEHGIEQRFHPVQSTRILFTPYKQRTFDLVADGTYARCGNKGQPYLFWNQNLDSYRIQVWGYLTENPKWKWYWDATISKAAALTNDCLKPAQHVRAIKVQEAWWNNFKIKEGMWDLGAGTLDGDGLPAGTSIKYGRTVWHSQGQLPYYIIGPPDGSTARQCVNQVMSVVEGGQ
jgi:hypothetical protein